MLVIIICIVLLHSNMQRRLKHITVVCLSVVVLLKMMAMPLVCLDYAMNKQFIAAVLCENKAKPVMHCNGKCHLRKQLAKASETPESQNDKGVSKTITLDFFEELNAWALDAFTMPLQFSYTYANSRILVGFYANIFHPPAFPAV
jgi:hypothetical protein